MSGGKYTSEYRALATCLVPARSKVDTYKTMTVSCFVLHARPVGKLGSESLEITFTTHAQNTIRMLRCVSCFDTCQSTTKALTRKHGETQSKRSCRQLKQFFYYSERKETAKAVSLLQWEEGNRNLHNLGNVQFFIRLSIKSRWEMQTTFGTL